MRRRSSKPAARGAQRPSRAGASSGWPWLQTPSESPAAASVGAESHTEGDGLSPCLTIRGLAALLGLSERTIRTRLRERPHELPPTIRLNSWSLRFINRSEEHTCELQSLAYLVCRLLLEKKKTRERL